MAGEKEARPLRYARCAGSLVSKGLKPRGQPRVFDRFNPIPHRSRRGSSFDWLNSYPVESICFLPSGGGAFGAVRNKFHDPQRLERWDSARHAHPLYMSTPPLLESGLITMHSEISCLILASFFRCATCAANIAVPYQRKADIIVI